MKIWILGAHGLLGRELAKQCTAKKIPFVATGREVDITDLQALKKFAKLEKPTHVINCAAYTDVDRAEEESERAFAVNARGPQHLGRVACEEGFRVLHISTDYVFGGTKKVAYTEEEECKPMGVYGKSKLAGEQHLLEELPTACIVRTSWLIGEGGKNFLSKLPQILNANEQLKIDDEQVNRMTSARDLADALFKLLDSSGVWHFANGGEATRYQIASYYLELCKQKGIPVRCKELLPISSPPAKAPRPVFSALATKKVESTLGPIRSWKEVLLEN